jgi:hypothetical protein
MQDEESVMEVPRVLTLSKWGSLLESLIVNLSPMQPSGELRLIAAVLAKSIEDEFKECRDEDRDVFGGGFFERGFVNYCVLIGVDPDQIKQSATESFTLVGMAA